MSMPEQSRGDRQTDCASPGALGDMAHARDGSAPRKEGLSTAYDQGTDQHRTDRGKRNTDSMEQSTPHLGTGRKWQISLFMFPLVENKLPEYYKIIIKTYAAMLGSINTVV